MWPPPEDHSDVVLCGGCGSVPCRAVFFMVKHFNLPVDLCGIDFSKDLYSPECLKVNPIHSIPFMMVYPKEEGGEPTGINGSDAIALYLVNRFRDLIPESFLPSDPLEQAKVMEKATFISDVVYRATMYQYVYPLMGLMTECQYDACKRDFSLQIVEDWAKEGSPYFMGTEPSFADFYWYSLWLGNNWVQNDDFDLPWRHMDVIEKYPASKKIIEAVAELDGPKTVFSLVIGEGDASAELISSTGFFGLLSKKLPGNARKFNWSGDVHPNFVAFAEPETKAVYDMPLNL